MMEYDEFALRVPAVERTSKHKNGKQPKQDKKRNASRRQRAQRQQISDYLNERALAAAELWIERIVWPGSRRMSRLLYMVAGALLRLGQERE